MNLGSEVHLLANLNLTFCGDSILEKHNSNFYALTKGTEK